MFSAVGALSPLLGLLELAIEYTPESAWEAGESLFEASRGDSEKKVKAKLEIFLKIYFCR